MRKLDAYIEMYLHSADNDNKQSTPEARQRINSLLFEREQALGITSDQLNELLPLIDVYSKDESAYESVVSKYESLRV